MLGYPRSFIESYCRTFHNGLTIEEKDEQVRFAHRDVVQHFDNLKMNNPLHQSIKIKTGLDQPIDEDVWQFL